MFYCEIVRLGVKDVFTPITFRERRVFHNVYFKPNRSMKNFVLFACELCVLHNYYYRIMY